MGRGVHHACNPDTTQIPTLLRMGKGALVMQPQHCPLIHTPNTTQDGEGFIHHGTPTLPSHMQPPTSQDGEGCINHATPTLPIHTNTHTLPRMGKGTQLYTHRTLPCHTHTEHPGRARVYSLGTPPNTLSCTHTNQTVPRLGKGILTMPFGAPTLLSHIL